VLDLSRLVAGNMATHVLADHGADVIKIEAPGRGDDLRRWRVGGVEVFWKVFARNKRSVELDFRSGEGRELFLELVGDAQVVVENFVPGKMEGWNLGPDTLLARNPSLIVLRVSGWGQSGPMARSPGFGTLVEARSGWAYMNGPADRPPTLPPLALADMIAGLYGASAVQTALRQVEVAGGAGQVVDLSLLEPILSILGAEAAQFGLTGTPTERSGNQSSHAAPRNVYAASDGGFVALSGSMQAMAERIFRAIERPELIDDARFTDNDARVAHRDELDAIIGGWIGGRTRDEALARFDELGVTAGPLGAIGDLFADPHVRERGSLVRLADASLGSVAMHGVVARLSRTPGAIAAPAPRLGEHSDEILAPYRARREDRS